MGRGKVLHLDHYPVALPGEDRTFGGNAFYVDLVPKSVWWANLRTMLPQSQWNILSKYVIHRAGGACEICGSAVRLEAHERWDFEKATGTQRLARLMCVCKLCHLSIHIGIASEFGLRQDVDNHIFLLTYWGKRERSKHIKEARQRWNELSTLDWEADVSVVVNAGFTTYPKDEVWRRVNEKQRKINETRESTRVTIDGLTVDVFDDAFKGNVVCLVYSDEESLRGLPLGDAGHYWTMRPELVDPPRSLLDLKTFITAYRRPHGINTSAQLEQALRGDGPKRLVIANGVEWSFEMMESALGKGILIWDA